MIQTKLHINQMKNEIVFQLRVKNHHNFPVTFLFPTSKNYDIMVKNQLGNQVYRASEGMSYLQAIQEITLEQNEEKSWQNIWQETRLPPGKYTVHAEICLMKIKPIDVERRQLRVQETIQIKWD